MVDGQQIGGLLPLHMTSHLLNGSDDLIDFTWMHFPESLVDFKVGVIYVRRKTHQLVGPNQAAKPQLVKITGGEMLGFVYNQTGQAPRALIELFQQSQHFLVVKLPITLVDDAYGGMEQFWIDNGFKCLVGPDPHVWCIDDPL